ncbi:hypothetical protein CON65_22235 [Bacillus pseudomycoides]|uniref:Uncharacterized protein n=2 Tax=Bacillus TaxID=1386 RepID=A0AA91V8J8_9BACI|nr:MULTISPECIES: hypothetical protein [Bacillus]PEU10877.1 hypothetical protein CN525_23085 [Bacillus sp. AFS014408]PEB47702.1 hypothetical protein COO03_25465 [Bacillus sp. AFS098217]PED80527.1 hypothetical protein CON65_22235 [Bacillus pseudomycoides]PEU18097.1 hypothetical protein CN524_00300 [Bacillus sp. AFS019443]PFW61646.1 hypothetical protein COL20_16530 [Bacillus sp. AFS075034]
MENYELMNHVMDVIAAQNELVICMSEMEKHKTNLTFVKNMLSHSWKGNSLKEAERRLEEIESKLKYRIDEFRKIEGDLENYRKAIESLLNQLTMMGPKY